MVVKKIGSLRCGSPAGYRNHKYHKTIPCAACKREWAKRQRKVRQLAVRKGKI